jgi:hypothetical protein
MKYSNGDRIEASLRLGEAYGSLRVKTLRRIYGVRFGRGYSDFVQLSDVLETLDETALIQLILDHESGRLQSYLA